MQNNNVSIRNKRASFEYEILDRFIAGIQLYGTEIKSIRENKASLNEAYCVFIGSELYVKMHIAEYQYGSFNQHNSKRDRKLLLTKKELLKLEDKSQAKGCTIVPLKLFINEKGLAKLEIALAKGKKIWDKREDIKDRDNKRELDRYMKQ